MPGWCQRLEGNEWNGFRWQNGNSNSNEHSLQRRSSKSIPEHRALKLTLQQSIMAGAATISAVQWNWCFSSLWMTKIGQQKIMFWSDGPHLGCRLETVSGCLCFVFVSLALVAIKNTVHVSVGADHVHPSMTTANHLLPAGCPIRK